MTVTKFITTPKLFEYLDTEVADALIRHDIRKLFAYAYVDEDHPSDEYIGLAKWGSDGLGSICSVPAHLKNPPKPYTSSQYEKMITVAEDLEALMEIAQLSIGHTLWMADLAKGDALNDNHHFWLNHINSLTLLGMASDRTRDLFLAVYYRTSLGKYTDKREKYKKQIGDKKPLYFHDVFVQAFIESTNDPSMAKREEPLECLCDLSERIAKKRKVRNETVHKLATRAGKLTKRFFETVKSHPSKESACLYSHEYEYYVRQEARGITQPSHAETLDSALTQVIEWYHDLVKVTSIVFDIEHSLRMDALQISPQPEGPHK